MDKFKKSDKISSLNGQPMILLTTDDYRLFSRGDFLVSSGNDNAKGYSNLIKFGQPSQNTDTLRSSQLVNTKNIYNFVVAVKDGYYKPGDFFLPTKREILKAGMVGFVTFVGMISVILIFSVRYYNLGLSRLELYFVSVISILLGIILNVYYIESKERAFSKNLYDLKGIYKDFDHPGGMEGVPDVTNFLQGFNNTIKGLEKRFSPKTFKNVLLKYNITSRADAWRVLADSKLNLTDDEKEMIDSYYSNP